MPKSVPLDAAQEALIDRLVAAGRYASAAEAVSAGIALLLDREDRLADLREAWREGAESGDYQPLDAALDELAEHYAKLEKAGP